MTWPLWKQKSNYKRGQSLCISICGSLYCALFLNQTRSRRTGDAADLSQLYKKPVSTSCEYKKNEQDCFIARCEDGLIIVIHFCRLENVYFVATGLHPHVCVRPAYCQQQQQQQAAAFLLPPNNGGPPAGHVMSFPAHSWQHWSFDASRLLTPTHDMQRFL